MESFVRYVLVGLFTNLAGYATYLLLTWLGGEPKLTMTVLYAVGATLSYFGNRIWTFSYKGKYTGSVLKYITAHILGYLFNLVILFIFVDVYGYPHQLIQGIAVVLVAVYLFLAMKLFVFNEVKGSGFT